ncbi:tripartite tricarboxylate transporter TctB family protein [Catelliglobosispora koreensis]|uniref:tripartite tricarboxylate transporter TctB family protein n=1 Tax=Catelliglobosispora koreensis TaxID=129052 RepID=UPI000381F227|nr:tripartite tricarboxylate transporter TctB family protein [Catelliglobosispora koreensis]
MTTPIELDVEAEPEPSGPATRLIAMIVPLAVGASALVNAYLLGVGTLTAPGAGLWPAFASAAMVIGSIVLLVRWRMAPNDCERFDRRTLHIGLAVASLSVFVVVFGGLDAFGWPGIGFEWSTFLLLAFWLRVLGQESWKTTVLVALGVTVALHLFFIELFQAPLPHLIGP